MQHKLFTRFMLCRSSNGTIQSFHRFDFIVVVPDEVKVKFYKPPIFKKRPEA